MKHLFPYLKHYHSNAFATKDIFFGCAWSHWALEIQNHLNTILCPWLLKCLSQLRAKEEQSAWRKDLRLLKKKTPHCRVGRLQQHVFDTSSTAHNL